MPASCSRAVFLSYASQDAAAAQRICDALRAAGVEVWFDQNELAGGDAWDAKIRKQIAECALLLPVISANTQTRREGYFRIEWRLAAQRTHGIADGTPFLVPVVIDETHDAEALVPAEFKAVQWTRLPNGETPDKFCARVKQLLDGTEVGVTLDRARETRTRNSLPPIVLLVGGAVVALVAVALWQPWKKSPLPASTLADAPAATPAGAKPVAPEPSPAAKLTEEAYRHYSGTFTREDLTLAQEFAKRATDLDPGLARAWGVRAGVEAAYLYRAFAGGNSPQARDAETFAKRALALDKNDAEALLALGWMSRSQGAQKQAEEYFRRALAVDPNNLLAPRYLSLLLRMSGRVPEAIAVMKDAVRRFPRDVMLRYNFGNTYMDGGNFAKAWEQYEAAVAVQPFLGAQLSLAQLALSWKGDVALMRAILDRVELTSRAELEIVRADLNCSVLERRADHVREALGHLAGDHIGGTPKAFFLAQAWEFEGRADKARQQWEAAADFFRERVKADPKSAVDRVQCATMLAHLGRADEGRADVEAAEQAWSETQNRGAAQLLAGYYAAAGDAAKAVSYLRRAVNRGGWNGMLSVFDLKLDPKYDRIRASPEFQELLANPPPLPKPIDDEPKPGGGR